MKYIKYLLACLLSLHISSMAMATDFQSLLNKLSTKRLSQKSLVVEQIITSNSAKRKEVLDSLLLGEVFYLRDSKEVVRAKKNNKEYEIINLITGQNSGLLKKNKIKKVVINNKIRKQIKKWQTSLDLESPNRDVRISAIKKSYNNLNQDIINKYKALKQKEQDQKVVKAFEFAENIFSLNNQDQNIRINAISSLSGALEPVVKNSLIALKDSDSSEIVRAKAAKSLEKIESKISFYKNVETLFFGLSYGSVLVLAAIGLAITFGVMKVINMAHGELIMLGAYTTYVVQLLLPDYIGASIFIAIPLAFIVSGLVGVLIQKTIISHLHGRPLETLLATFGVSLVLQQAVRSVFSPLNRSVASPQWMSGSLDINPILSLTWSRLYIILFCLLVFFVLFMILKKTNLGLQVRAVSQDRNMAKSMGIKSNRVDAMTFGLGSGIAGVAGVALSQLTNVGPNLGQGYIIDSFMVVVFGGVGNLWGVLVGGLGLGVLNKFMEPWVGAVLAKVLILIFIILFIQKRPKGLFPQKGRVAVD